MRRIRFEHVVKRYPGASRPAVDDVSLEVAAGEFSVLLGPSGSGKTTLLKLVNRLYEPTAGRIFVDDAEIHDLEPNELRRHIGYVIQQTGLFPHMTVAQNVAVVPRLLAWKKQRIAARVDELLEMVGLQPVDEYRRRYPAQLSGGEQQRVGVARALAADPGVLLMDEPFGAIDAITRGSLQEEMQRLHRRLQVTVLFVTHDVDEALRLADRVAVLHEGRLLQSAAPLELLLRPADEFVARLVGSGDVMRKLRMLRVADALPSGDGASAGGGLPAVGAEAPVGSPAIGADASLQEALLLLLGSEARELVVQRAGRSPARLSLRDIHATLTAGASEEGGR